MSQTSAPQTARVSSGPRAVTDRAAGATSRGGIVRASGRVFTDDQGPFLALGATLFWGLWGFEHDRARLGKNLEAIARGGFDYIRVLAVVGPQGWSDRTVDPRNEHWADHVAAFTDWAYDEHALRVQWTVFGGVDTTPTAEGRARLVDRFATAIKGRHHKVFAVELANEGHQNGFGGEGGRAELKRLATRLRASYPGLLATTAPRSPACSERAASYKGAPASFVTLHFPRTGGNDRWHLVQAPWRVMASDCKGVPDAYSNNEPIGPYSSVSEERDPLVLAMSAAATWASGVGAYVLHTGAGIRGGGTEDQSGGRPADMWDVQDWSRITASLQCVRSVLPRDLPNWSRLTEGSRGHPFTATRPASAKARAPLIAAARNGEFTALALGKGERGPLKARRTLTVRAVDPLSCATLVEATLDKGESAVLPDGSPAVLVLGRFR